MTTHEQVLNVNSRLRSGRALGLIAAALTLLGAHSASATGPTLFTGIEKQAGGIVLTTNLITTSPTYYGYYGAGGAGTAQVTSAGGFAVYANQFSTTFSYTFTLLPIYPYLKVEKTVMNDAGTFGNSYFVPSVAVSVPTAMGYPTLPTTMRAGFIRVLPGPKGFGGQVRWNITKVYTFDYVSSLGTLHLSMHPDHNPAGNFDHGGSPLGAQGPTDNPCCRSYPLGYPPTTYPQYVYSAALATIRGPWLTGMLTVGAPQGAVSTTTTQTGVDARSAPFLTGVISMVTPRNQYVWQKDGAGNLLSLRSNFGVIHALELTFLPEPGQLAMLASGIFGLLGLQSFRRRRR
jgi:hypothetical protein